MACAYRCDTDAFGKNGALADGGADGSTGGEVTMGLFKSKYEKELDTIILRINMNMSNNYKDNAQADLKKFEDRLNEMKAEGLLKDKACSLYESELGIYKERLKGYTHKDQKPYWT